MTIVILLAVAIGLAAVSGLPAALGSRTSRAGERVAFALLAIASACGLAAAGWVAIRGEPVRYALHWAIPGELAIRLDPLAAMFLVQIFVIAPLGAMYGLSYWPQAEHPDNGRKLRLFYGLLAASMALLVVADDAIPFLMGWEIMALTAFIVVTTDDVDPAAREAGFVYLVATRVGTLSLFAAFALLRWSTGSWSFHPAHAPGAAVATAMFLLAVLGCLLKAGAIPLHIWLPGAHANAPSHVSALMSGVLIKMGIYGVLRITSFFEHPPLFWGILLFTLGAVSGVFGVAFALGQHDIKRLLAYHSVENIGIILIGLGVALVGRTTGEPILVALGLAGALLHVWNHGLFKSLLFFSAGAVVHATHTREMDALGGVGARMPKTAAAFLVGAIAICGLPPFNGFVSELFIYLGSFHAALSASTGAAAVGAFGVTALALIGALAVACFVKAFGVVFLGTARTEHSSHAKEAGRAMTTPMLVLGLLCAFIGVAPAVVAPVLEHATASWAPEAAETSLVALAPLHALSITSGLLLVLLVAFGWVLVKRWSPARVRTGPTWDCGYAAPTPRMQYTASSFADGLVGLFSWALRPRTHAPKLTRLFPTPERFHSEVPDLVLDRAVLPASRSAARGLVWFRWVQQGSTQLYVLYIVVALVLTLLLLR